MECQNAAVVDALRSEVKVLKDELAAVKRENNALKIQQVQHEKALEAMREAQERSRADDYGEQLVRLKLQLADLEEKRRKRAPPHVPPLADQLAKVT
ncbi:hypothetical protein HDV00_011958 [Rhizophlyctis rosea]|nr:hypothetical protein HDV00_011958 [Rhizophlyctis rosea]